MSTTKAPAKGRKMRAVKDGMTVAKRILRYCEQQNTPLKCRIGYNDANLDTDTQDPCWHYFGKITVRELMAICAAAVKSEIRELRKAGRK